MQNTRTKKDKVLWIIGGGQLQIPLIEEAHKLGLATLVTDRNAHLRSPFRGKNTTMKSGRENLQISRRLMTRPWGV